MLGEEKPSATAPAAAAKPATVPVSLAEAAPKPAPKTAPKPAPPAAAPKPPPPAPAAKVAAAAPDLDESLDVEPGTFSNAPAPPILAHELNAPPSTSFDGTDQETVQEFEQALDSLDAPLPPEPEIADVTFAESERPEPEAAVTEEVRHVKVRSNIDILAELERLRKTSTASDRTVEEKPRRAPAGISVDDLLASSLNHRKEVNKVFDVVIPRQQLSQGHQVRVGLKFEDRNGKEIGEGQSFSVELQTRSDIQKLLLSLKFHIQGK
jgi:hypothetical protein